AHSSVAHFARGEQHVVSEEGEVMDLHQVQLSYDCRNLDVGSDLHSESAHPPRCHDTGVEREQHHSRLLAETLNEPRAKSGAAVDGVDAWLGVARGPAN